MVLCFVGASAYEVYEKKDDWPLSNYPMYADIAEMAFRGRMVGVSATGEFP